MKKTQMNLCPKYFFFSYLLKNHAFSQDFFVLKMFLIFVQRKKKILYFTFLMFALEFKKIFTFLFIIDVSLTSAKGAKKSFWPRPIISCLLLKTVCKRINSFSSFRIIQNENLIIYFNFSETFYDL